MKNFSQLKNCVLFSGLAEDEIESMLKCLSAAATEYPKNRMILRVGEAVNAMGVVLDGSVQILREDFWGNRNIIARAAPGQLFAESYACTPGAALGVSVMAETACTVLFLDVRRLLTSCSSACEFHARLIRNLLAVTAQKNLLLNEKISHLSQRTTREKLLSFLSAEALRQGSPSFEIAFNRQQLADYLSVDRSAMSNELCKMRDEGLLNFERSRFELIGGQPERR